MTKTWEQMTEAEKIEDLRRDVVRIFRVLNSIDHSLSALAAHLDQAQKTAREASTAVSALRDQLETDQET
jgi:chromosome segregation ATPase